MSKQTTVQINIHGTQLSFKTDDPDYVHALADLIEEQIRKIESSGKVASPAKTIALAALNIADELFRLRRENEEISEKFSKRLGVMLDMTEEAYRLSARPKDQNEGHL